MLDVVLFHLSNMNDLRGSVPDAVHAQQLESFRVEDELQKSVRSPQHLSLCQFLIVCDTDLLLEM